MTALGARVSTKTTFLGKFASWAQTFDHAEAALRQALLTALLRQFFDS